MPTTIRSPLSDFYINVGRKPLQDLYPRAHDHIKTHAFNGSAHHDCPSVSLIIDHLTNTLLIPNQPLTNQGHHCRLSHRR